MWYMYVMIVYSLTDVTSSGIVNTIRKEKLHAVSTDNVTRGCCLWTFPYLYSDVVANVRATIIPNNSKYAIVMQFLMGLQSIYF